MAGRRVRRSVVLFGVRAIGSTAATGHRAVGNAVEPRDRYRELAVLMRICIQMPVRVNPDASPLPHPMGDPLSSGPSRPATLSESR